MASALVSSGVWFAARWLRGEEVADAAATALAAEGYWRLTSGALLRLVALTAERLPVELWHVTSGFVALSLLFAAALVRELAEKPILTYAVPLALATHPLTLSLAEQPYGFTAALAMALSLLAWCLRAAGIMGDGRWTYAVGAFLSALFALGCGPVGLMAPVGLFLLDYAANPVSPFYQRGWLWFGGLLFGMAGVSLFRSVYLRGVTQAEFAWELQREALLLAKEHALVVGMAAQGHWAQWLGFAAEWALLNRAIQYNAVLALGILAAIMLATQALLGTLDNGYDRVTRFAFGAILLVGATRLALDGNLFLRPELLVPMVVVWSIFAGLLLGQLYELMTGFSPRLAMAAVVMATLGVAGLTLFPLGLSRLPLPGASPETLAGWLGNPEQRKINVMIGDGAMGNRHIYRVGPTAIAVDWVGDAYRGAAVLPGRLPVEAPQ